MWATWYLSLSPYLFHLPVVVVGLQTVLTSWAAVRDHLIASTRSRIKGKPRRSVTTSDIMWKFQNPNNTLFWQCCLLLSLTFSSRGFCVNVQPVDQHLHSGYFGGCDDISQEQP